MTDFFREFLKGTGTGIPKCNLGTREFFYVGDGLSEVFLRWMVS